MVTAHIGKTEIAALIPHAGTMCLLDSVVRWDSTSIVCRALVRSAEVHPLATGGRLDWVCGIEYAAQAMAVHGGLTAGRRPTAGYLASVRDVVCHSGRPDMPGGDIEVAAALLFRHAAGAVYGFTLCQNEVLILEGRAAVMIDASPLPEQTSDTIAT